MIASLIDPVRRAWHDLASFAFPGDCPSCGETLVPPATTICLDCQEQLAAAAAAPCCAICAAPLPDAAGPCGRCHGKGVRPFATIAKLTPFDVPVTRELVHAVKYGHRWPLVDWLAEQLEHSPRVRSILDHADVLVPVPLHWRRHFGRGFNQADLLARALARHRGLIVAHVVSRARATSSQTAFHSRAARRRNLTGAFRLRHPFFVDGRHVVIVDDVMTSGSTLQAIARAIRAGARPASLSAIVVAAANPMKSDLTPA